METKLVLQMLRKNWWVAALVALVAVFAALLYGFMATPIYQASSRYLIAPNLQKIPQENLVTTMEALDKRSIVTTYAEYFNGRQIYLNVLQSLGLDPLVMEQKGYSSNTVILPNSNVLELTTTGPDASLVFTLANDIGERATNALTQLYPTFIIDNIDPAVIPEEPISPQPLRDSAVALVLGLIGGSAAAILSEQLRLPLNSYRERLRLDKPSGVFNKGYFRRLVDEDLAKPESSSTLVALVQLGGLLEVKDALPPVAGDLLLSKIAGILRGDLRGDDVVGRWSDSSFCLLMHMPARAVRPTFERIRESLMRPISLDQYNEKIKFEPYIGVALNKKNTSTNALLARVESSLEASRSGTDPIKID
jgi:diguanylate cyclase (GGDEF)-like protein